MVLTAGSGISLAIPFLLAELDQHTPCGFRMQEADELVVGSLFGVILKRLKTKGGKAAHEKGTAHEFDSKEASKAGKKGGESHGKGSGSSARSPSSSRGGSSAQHAKAGSQSHKHT